MKSIKLLLIATLVIGSLTACTANKVEGPTHKARASACLIAPAVAVPGSPEKQLGYDLVEAKVVYGLNAKEVSVPKNSTDSQIDKLLFNSLKAGCVYFIATDSMISSRVTNFVGNHKFVVALIVGGDVPADQPASVRWIADDLASGATLAGFGAAAKAATDNLYLLVQDSYFEHDLVISSFTAGVKAYNEATKKNVELTVLKSSNGAELENVLNSLDPQVVLAVFAGKSIWQTVKKSGREFLVGSDLQLGNAQEVDARVFASVERNFNLAVLNTAKDLIEKRFDLDPALSEKNALVSGFIEFRPRDDAVFDGTTTDLLTAYKAQLVADQNN